MIKNLVSSTLSFDRNLIFLVRFELDLIRHSKLECEFKSTMTKQFGMANHKTDKICHSKLESKLKSTMTKRFWIANRLSLHEHHTTATSKNDFFP